MTTMLFVEQIDQTFDHVVEWAQKNPNSVLMLCVCQKYRTDGNIFKTYPCLGDKDIGILKDYYRQLLTKVKNPIGLHVHVARFNEIDNMSYIDQYNMIKFGKDFLEGLGLTITCFSAGWWSYNKDTFDACIALGITNFYVHVYHELPHFSTVGINMVLVDDAIHDYNFIVKEK